MSSQQQQSFEAELQFHTGDRLNFSYVLANQLLTLQKAMLVGEKEAQIVVESFVALIPNGWKDDKFNKAFKASVVEIKVDNRPLCCGNIRMNEETCKKVGIVPWVTKKQIDYFKQQQAVIDLLDRRKLLLRKTFTEKMTGRRYRGKGKDIRDKDIEAL